MPRAAQVLTAARSAPPTGDHEKSATKGAPRSALPPLIRLRPDASADGGTPSGGGIEKVRGAARRRAPSAAARNAPRHRLGAGGASGDDEPGRPAPV